MFYYKLNNGITIYKWSQKEEPTESLMQQKLDSLGFISYGVQTCSPWFERSMHAHDYEEIRAALSGCITFHFENLPITLEAGDILIIPPGIPHQVYVHNPRPFTAIKGSRSGERKVTEHGDGKGSLEYLQQNRG
jgi:mannose-6-phosphate isomerase-like protein (cupin superfamily)